MTIRMTGLASNLDTESMITALTSTYQTHVDDLKGQQKKLSWTQDKWKSLNKDITSFYNGTLGDMRFSTAYNKKTTTASNTSAVTVVTGDTAMNASQSLSVTSLASTAYMTGGKLALASGATATSISSSTTMQDLGLTADGTLKIKMGVTDGSTASSDAISVAVNKTDKISDVISRINSATSSSSGTKISANFDATNGRIYLGASDSGKTASFAIDSSNSSNLLTSLGLGSEGKYVAGADAAITLNGVEYTSKSNNFTVNGLTITANQTASDITLTTKQDTSGIYDTIKSFLKSYNTLVNNFDTLYNADSASKYTMLTDDEKDKMTDDEVNDWEDKIKASLLRNDETLGTVKDSMRTIMNQSFSVTDKNGTTSQVSLSTFGINTLSYFDAEENERNAFHIDGDKDDSSTKGNTDLLSAAIASDPDKVSDFFMQMSKSLYSKMSDLMKATDYSSSYTVYEDKLMASQYSAYTDKISDAQTELEEKQDYYYSKFSKMETALTKLKSSSSSLSSLFGTSSS